MNNERNEKVDVAASPRVAAAPAAGTPSISGISVLILTLNEEANLSHCLDGLRWSDDVVLLDSFSTDGTERIALERGVRFYQRRFDDFASQRNYGLHSISYPNSWVLMLDADETVSPELVAEMRNCIASAAPDVALFRMRRKDHLFGQWMRRCNAYPTWFGRLVRPQAVQVMRSVNEEYHTDGRVGYLQHHLLHYSYSAGFHDWFQEQNLHSTMEAERLLQDADAQRWHARGLFSADPAVRRRTLKHLAFTLPGRPILSFFYFYLVRFGFLDGRAALSHCLLRATYEYMIDLKVKEGRRRRSGLPI